MKELHVKRFFNVPSPYNPPVQHRAWLNRGFVCYGITAKNQNCERRGVPYTLQLQCKINSFLLPTTTHTALPAAITLGR
jgi:hypothetical protein